MVQINTASESQSNPIRVLLVEDNPIDVRLLRADFSRLASPDFEMTAVGRLSDAVQLLLKTPFDVILLDLFLEDAAGFETLSLMLEAAPYIPIVVLTGADDEALALKAVKYGAQDYIIKGTSDTRTLLRAIRYAIERRHVQEALRSSEERYRDLFQNANDSIYTLDLEGRFTSANRKYQTMTGYSLDELIGKHIKYVVAEPNQETLRQMIEAAAKGGNLPPYDIDLLAKDGRWIPVEVRARLIREHGNPTGTQGIARDLSERRLLEQSILEKQKLEAIGTLAGGVAHNFNNMLTVISGHCNLLLEQVDRADRTRPSLEAICRASDRATNLTHQLLAFSRKKGFKPAAINLNEIVIDMQQLIESVLGENIALQLELAPDLRLLKADRGHMEQIIMNLTMNACQAMKDGGTLMIGTTQSPSSQDYSILYSGPPAISEVLLTIRDTGCGMSSETCTHIFDPFFTTKGLAAASGMGLSTVYGMVNQNGGSIRVSSIPGTGTTFFITIPQFEPEVESSNLANETSRVEK